MNKKSSKLSNIKDYLTTRLIIIMALASSLVTYSLSILDNADALNLDTGVELIRKNLNETREAIVRDDITGALDHLIPAEKQFSAVKGNMTTTLSDKEMMLVDNETALDAATKHLNKTHGAIENYNMMDAHYHLDIVEKELLTFTENALNKPPSETYLTYENTAFGYKIDYPSTWIKQDLSNSSSSLPIMFLPPQANNTIVRISVENLSSGDVSLDVFASMQTSILRLSSPTNITLLESNAISLPRDSPSAHRIVYTVGEGQEKGMKVFSIKENKAYVITYVSNIEEYSHYLPTIQRMINSLVI